MEVSGEEEHFSEPGGWMVKLEFVMAVRRFVVLVLQSEGERREKERTSST